MSIALSPRPGREVVSGPRLCPSPPTLHSLGSWATWTLQGESCAAKLLVGPEVGPAAASGSSQPGPFATEGPMKLTSSLWVSRCLRLQVHHTALPEPKHRAAQMGAFKICILTRSEPLE